MYNEFYDDENLEQNNNIQNEKSESIYNQETTVEENQTWENKMDIKEESSLPETGLNPTEMETGLPVNTPITAPEPTPEPTPELVKYQNKPKGETTTMTNKLFKGDNFLVEGLNPSLFTADTETLDIPVEQKDLYQLPIDISSVESTISEAFKANPRRVSFSLEEIGLHNRLVETRQINQDFADFVIIASPRGNVAVIKDRDSMGEELNRMASEARALINMGKRIAIPLFEDYEFEDEYGIRLLRSRFRVSFSEIKSFVARMMLKSTITADGHLILFE